MEIDGSGRTDAGVHASGSDRKCSVERNNVGELFYRGINRILPEDIRILEADLVKSGFHARKSAIGKVYEYRIDTGTKPDVFQRRYCFHFPHELDLDIMRRAAEKLKEPMNLQDIQIKKMKSPQSGQFMI